jgi:hypothetical protein
MENFVLFPQYSALIHQLHDDFNARERLLIQELCNNDHQITLASKLAFEAAEPGLVPAIPHSISNIIRFLRHRQAELVRDIRWV